MPRTKKKCPDCPEIPPEPVNLEIQLASYECNNCTSYTTGKPIKWHRAGKCLICGNELVKV